MADSTISALPAGSYPSPNDLYPMVQGGQTVHITHSQLQSALNPVNAITPLVIADGITDNWTVLQAALNTAKVTGRPIQLPSGVIRTTKPLDGTDAVYPIHMFAAGVRNTLLYGDFTGPDQAVVDLSFSNDNNRIDGHCLEDFSMCSNGVVGDPMGVKAKGSQQQMFRRLMAPGVGTVILGASRALSNIGLMLTKVNNTEVLECDLFCGYQPIAYDIGNTVLFSGINGGVTLTATLPVFTAAHVNQYVVVQAGGGSSDATDFYVGMITAQTGLTATVSPAFGASFTGQRASIGFITGSVNAASTNLTLDQPVLTNAHVGMRIHIPYGHTVSDASNKKGLLCTYIQSVTDSTHCVLGAASDNTVASVPIIFAPALFVGQLREEEGDSRQTNDCFLGQVQIESFEAVGMIVNKALFLDCSNLKLHGKYFELGINSVTRSFCGAILSEVKTVYFRGQTQLVYPWHPTYGNIWMMGSRGTFILENFETYGGLKDQPVVYFDAENTSAARVDIGPGTLTDGITKHSAFWRPVAVPGTNVNYQIANTGPISYRGFSPTANVVPALVTPSMVCHGFASNPGNGVLVNNNTAINFKPDRKFGLLAMSADTANATAFCHYRRSSGAGGALMTGINLGSLVQATTGNLSGTTGTAGKVTVSAGTDDTLYIENRSGGDIRFQWTIMANGDS